MSGALTTLTEIGGRAHDPLTEMVLPDAIDGNTRGERIVRAGNPLRQIQSATPFLD